MAWVVYILSCADGTLYTGITNNLDKRLADHERGRGARYTQGRGPFTVIYKEPHPDRSSASRREAAIKRLSRGEKLALTPATAGP
jgi:putative endonuclease